MVYDQMTCHQHVMETCRSSVVLDCHHYCLIFMAIKVYLLHTRILDKNVKIQVII